MADKRYKRYNMAYKKQKFFSGQLVNAQQMENIENAIIALEPISEADNVVYYKDSEQGNIVLEATPTANTHVTNKKYVDNQIEANFAAANALLNRFENMVCKPSTTEKYNSRVTANGAKANGINTEVCDGSKAKLLEIAGDTIKCNNVIPFPYYNTTGREHQGITYTIRDDGAIILNGTKSTTTKNSYFILYQDSGKPYVLKKDRTYWLSIKTDNNNQNIAAVIHLHNSETDYSYQYVRGNESPCKIQPDHDITLKQLYIEIFDSITTTFKTEAVYVMLNEGSAPLPYQKYFTGLKHASISGLTSTGTNLFNAKAIKNASIGVNDDGSQIIIPLQLDNNGFIRTNATLKQLCPGLEVGSRAYLYFTRKPTNEDNGTFNESYNLYIYLEEACFYWHNGECKTITSQDLESRVALYGNRGYANNTALETCQITLHDFRIVAKESVEFKPYIPHDQVLFTEQISLPKWDKINVDAKKYIKQTQTITFTGDEKWKLANTKEVNADDVNTNKFRVELTLSSSGEGGKGFSKTKHPIICNYYTDITAEQTYRGSYGIGINGDSLFIYDPDFSTPEQLGGSKKEDTATKWKEHLKSLYDAGNPLTIAYKKATSTTTTNDKRITKSTYIARVDGMEQVVGNDNAEYGAINTLAQDYIAFKR